MNRSTKAISTNKETEKDLESAHMPTDASMKESGRMIKLMESENTFMKMEIITWANGRMIRKMAMVHLFTEMERVRLSLSGLTTNNMDRVKKYGRMEHHMKVITNMDRSTAKASKSGQTKVVTWETLLMVN